MDRPLFAVRPSDQETHEKQHVCMPMDAFQRVSRSLVDPILVVEDTNGNPAEYREWLLHWAGRQAQRRKESCVPRGPSKWVRSAEPEVHNT